MILSRTPFRISLLGGGSDYPQYYRDHEGMVLASSIDKYCHISVRYLQPYFEHRHRIVYSNIESVGNCDEIKHPSARECFRYMKVDDWDTGIEVHHDGDLPARSGIGSSSSFTVGLLNALHNLQGNPISKMDLAKEAIHIEQDMIKENVGSQDQITTSMGGLNLIKFTDSNMEVCPIKDKNVIRKLESYLMLVFTGFPHLASDVAKDYQFEERKKEIGEMVRLTQNGYECLMKGDVESIGGLLHEAWQYKKSLSKKITTGYIDYVYDKAKSVGAMGGKLCGAGGAGFMLLFAHPDKQDAVKQALNEHLFVDFKLENKGTQIVVNNGYND